MGAMELALKNDACGYKRREPEQELLHNVLAEHLETFLELTMTKVDPLSRTKIRRV